MMSFLRPRDPSIGQDQVTADERTRRLDGRPFPQDDEFSRVGTGQTGPCAPLPKAEQEAVSARLAAEREATREPIGMDEHADAFLAEEWPNAPRTIRAEKAGIFRRGWRAHARVAEADRMATIEANRATYETRIRELEREIGKRDTDIELLEERVDELETDGSNR